MASATPEVDAKDVQKLASSLDEQFARTVTLLRQDFAALESRLVESVQIQLAERPSSGKVRQDLAVQQLSTRLDMVQSRSEKVESDLQSLKLVWMEKSQVSDALEEQLEAIQDQLAEFKIEKVAERIGRIEKHVSLGASDVDQSKQLLGSPVMEELKATSLLLAGRLEVVEHRVASVCAAFGKQQRTDQAAELSPKGQIEKRFAYVFPEMIMRQEEMQSQLVAIQAELKASRDSCTPMSLCSTAAGSAADFGHELSESQRSVWSQVEAPGKDGDQIAVPIADLADPLLRRCMPPASSPALINEGLM